ncbi:hypothetical protein IFM89_000913 [Coptis chinensis]|uniref:Spt6-like S1/OB domain-containing protein n=1 Tax=Coptis chinensis TaxID=261450 RepID=A0A835M3H7_9MAGN|nr:hypothetical protein IFM89_000913 [Coptis chinensis]
MKLLHGFRDWRIPYVEPNQDEAFYMLIGETKDTIAEGRVASVTLRKVLPQKAICELESRVTGILTVDDYSDMRRPDDLSLELNEGDVLNCMIKNIQTNQHQHEEPAKEAPYDAESIGRCQWVNLGEGVESSNSRDPEVEEEYQIQLALEISAREDPEAVQIEVVKQMLKRIRKNLTLCEELMTTTMRVTLKMIRMRSCLKSLVPLIRTLKISLALLDHTFGRKGRALEEEIKDLNDPILFALLGSQDTLLDLSGAHYFYQCYIQGSIDFSFWSARLIQQLLRIERKALQIGVRLWRGHKVFFCKVYNKRDWDDILGNNLGTVWLGEYKCKGRGADLRRQVPWAISFRDEEARPFMDRNFNMNFINEDRWLQL